MSFVLKILLIFPAAIYGLIVWLRNLLYDRGFLHDQHFHFPIINVGNLAAGGTGKTPHIEYLIKILKPHAHIATLSRGYKRKTTGYRVVQTNSTIDEAGDEPLLFKLKNPDINVTVGEDRLLAIPQILQHIPGTEVILMDDAFQHRSVTPGLNILLTEHDRPFYNDNILPLGYLRDTKSSYRRADIIIVTKCPEDLSMGGQEEIARKINPMPYQRVFFSTIRYGQPYSFFDAAEKLMLHQNLHIGLIAGIANEVPMVQYLSGIAPNITLKKYPDHYRFTQKDIEDWVQMRDKHPEMVWVTTEKDAVRLLEFAAVMNKADLPLFVLPIEIDIIGANKEKFDYYIKTYVYQKLLEIGRINNESLLE